MTVTFVVGLPGSGKSHHAADLARRTGATLVDDPRADPAPLAAALTGSADVVVADVNLCDPKTRERATAWVRSRRPDVVLGWVCFANDPAACLANVARRKAAGDGRDVERYVVQLAGVYEIPADVEPLPVWTPPLP